MSERARTPEYEYDVTEKDAYGRNHREFDVQMRQLINPTWRARMASSLIERWGMIAGRPEGEDSAGRTKLALMSPQDVVSRACETADLAVTEFERLGWVDRLPGQAEIDRLGEQKRAEKEQSLNGR